MAKVFTTTTIYPYVSGGTLVEFNVHPLFSEPGPWSFQLQVSHSGVTAADDWYDVGSPVVGNPGTTNYAKTDVLQRVWANSDRLFYRIKLTTALSNSYYSAPKAVTGELPRPERLIAREILRQADVRFRKSHAGSCGLLFKRKNWGTPCDDPGCVDYDTQAQHNELSTRCYGTGWIGGYFPGQRIWLDFEPDPQNAVIQTDNLGTTNSPRNTTAKCIACPIPMDGDFFWEENTDRRYEITSVGIISAIRNVPLICQVSLALVPPSDIIYDFPVA